ncbi:MAG: bifunctional precorrin-2 dehydrogenase/sirohydrochlorin ferrochelatase [Deltaproteobacteria bacterium]|nr:bifunctional precorrin-2 dehydrogenase/sirohydrochlorin ferrochelatase [Deltaproteobacteria bacterium]
MKFYPVHLNVSGMRCVVVGGGEVAERKVVRLLECDADVVLVGKTITRNLEAIKREGRIAHIPDDYRSDYIEDAFLVIGATDRDEINEKIYLDSKERNILVNIVDDPERCQFIVPSQLRRGDLLISISTGGKSPALARRLRENLEVEYGSEYQILLDIMGGLRGKIIARGASSKVNKNIFESILDTDILRYIREGDWNRVRETVRDLTGEDIGSIK